jgi:hypothetical protein
VTHYQLDALEHGWIYVAVAAVSSAVQWHFAADSRLRVLSSLHGILFIAAFLFAVAVSPFTDTYFSLIFPFLGLSATGLAACIANPFLGASRFIIAIATSIVSLASGACLTLFGAIVFQTTWF